MLENVVGGWFGACHKVNEKINTHVLAITTKSHLCFHFALYLSHSISFCFSLSLIFPLYRLCILLSGLLPFPLAVSMGLPQFGKPIGKYFIALWLKSELFDYFYPLLIVTFKDLHETCL